MMGLLMCFVSNLVQIGWNSQTKTGFNIQKYIESCIRLPCSRVMFYVSPHGGAIGSGATAKTDKA